LRRHALPQTAAAAGPLHERFTVPDCNRIGCIARRKPLAARGSRLAPRVAVTLQLVRWDVVNATILLEATYGLPDIPDVPDGWRHDKFPRSARRWAFSAGSAWPRRSPAGSTRWKRCAGCAPR
jgi:hypothetical protein